MPEVSIIVPCYNEERTIALLLDALACQTFPLQEMEIIIADGMSTDRTRASIEQFQARHPKMSLTLVDNPKRHIPAALNRAIAAARGRYLIRLDAHAVPAADYVARCVEALRAGRAENVGGIWDIAPGPARCGAPAGWVSRAIAAAAAHPLGAGDAHYRHAAHARYVDTVPFGAFHRALLETIGPFDETLLTNEDYEFNVRIRQAGGKIWLDPAIRSTYFARSTLGALARQYLRYGYWKGRMLRRYPETLRWRQAIPPLFVLSLAALAGLSFFFRWAQGLLLFETVLYAAVLMAAGLHAARRRKDPWLVVGLPVAIATMHLCWGGALLWGLVSRPSRLQPQT